MRPRTNGAGPSVGVTNQAADALHAVPLIGALIGNIGATTIHVLGDAGYSSDASATALTVRGINPLLAIGKVKHGELLSPRRGRALYALQKVLVGPVSGLITGGLVRGSSETIYPRLRSRKPFHALLHMLSDGCLKRG